MDGTTANLRALLASSGVADADAATVDCLRQIALEQYSAVLGTASRLAAHSGATSISAEAALAAADLHMLHQQPQRERTLDMARFTNGRVVSWPISSDLLVPGGAPPTEAPSWRGGAGGPAAATAAAAAAAAQPAASLAVGGTTGRVTMQLPARVAEPAQPAAVAPPGAFLPDDDADCGLR